MRIKYLDIAKGILIILVVIGHLTTPYKEIIYYFHMPCFFIISGVFIKENVGKSKSFLLDKTKSLIIPYFIYLIIIGIIFYDFQPDYIIKLLLGGRFLVGPFSPFWFITALFFGFVFFFLVEKYISKKYRLAVILLLYGLACLESIYFEVFPKLFYIPLCIDVSFLILLYLYIGRSIKPLLIRINDSVKYHLFLFFFSTLGLLIFFFLNFYDIFSYVIDMKYVIYSNPIFNLLVPLLFLSFILSLSKLIEKPLRILSYFGEGSLVIMYLHLPIIYLLKNELPLSVLVVLACIIPLLFHYVFNKFYWTKRLFLGRWKS